MKDEHFEGTGMEFYRCTLCGHANAPWELVKGEGCKKCGGKYIKPTSLSIWEKARFLLRYPLIWKWENALQTKKEP